MTYCFLSLSLVILCAAVLARVKMKRCRHLNNLFCTSVLEKFFLPLGILLYAKIPKLHSVGPKTEQNLRSMFPTKAAEDVREEYQCHRMALLCAVLVLSFCLCAGVCAMVKRESPLAYRVDRPPYDSGDQIQTVIVQTEDTGTDVEIVIPRQGPNKTQAEKLLDQAEQRLDEELAALGTIRQSQQLPTEYGDVEIAYEASAHGEVSEDGWVWLPDTGETAWDTTLVARLSIGSYDRYVQYELHFDRTPVLTLAEAVQSNIVTAPEYIELPSRIHRDGIDQNLSYHTADESGDAVKMCLSILLLPVILVVLVSRELQQQKKKRDRALELAYPILIQKLTMFLGTGQSISAAWENVIRQTSDGSPLKEEMTATYRQIKNGASMQTAFRDFAARIPNSNYRKLGNMLARNLKRGDQYLLDHLREMNKDAWDNHKRVVRIQSEEAGTKMLLPMMLMLMVVLILVMAPALITLQI